MSINISNPIRNVISSVADTVGAFAEGRIHGNFCGPGWGDPAKTPTDAIDATCKEHDAGYGKNGYFDLGSDLKLIGEMTEHVLDGDLPIGERAEALGLGLVFVGVAAAVSGPKAAGLAQVELGKEILSDGKEIGKDVYDGGKKVAETAKDVVTGAPGAVAGAAKKAWSWV